MAVEEAMDCDELQRTPTPSPTHFHDAVVYFKVCSFSITLPMVDSTFAAYLSYKQVEQILYAIPYTLLKKRSGFFNDLFDFPGQGGTEDDPIAVPAGITAKEFDCLFSYLFDA